MEDGTVTAFGGDGQKAILLHEANKISPPANRVFSVYPVVKRENGVLQTLSSPILHLEGDATEITAANGFDRQGLKIEFVDTPMGGTATINGAAKYGETLTLDTSGITGVYTSLVYQWKSGGMNVGSNQSSYTLTEDDIGKAITCLISDSGHNGYVTATLADTVTKADGPAAPTGLSGVAPTEEDGTGKISGTDIAMEYSADAAFTSPTACTAGETALSPGSYYVRVAETATHFAGAAAAVTVPGYGHTHVWGKGWTFDETHHWHSCTFSGGCYLENKQMDGYAEHSFVDNVCRICGYAVEPLLTLGGVEMYVATGVSYLKNGATALGGSESDYNAKYDAATKTLSLKGYQYSGAGTGYASNRNAGMIAKLPGNSTLNIVLADGSENSIVCTDNSGLRVSDSTKVIISGGGSLYLEGRYVGMSCNSSVTVNSGSITCFGGDNGIGGGSWLRINGGTVTAKTDSVTSWGAAAYTGRPAVAAGMEVYKRASDTEPWILSKVPNPYTQNAQVMVRPAAVKYDLWVGNTQVTELNAADVLRDAAVSYDAATKTLSLNGLELSGTDPNNLASIYSDLGSGSTLNIVLAEGSENSIAMSGSSCIRAASGNIKLSGAGALSLGNAAGYTSNTGNCLGADNGSVTVEGGAKLRIGGGAYAINAKGDITVGGSDTRLISSPGFGSLKSEVRITIKGATVLIYGSAAYAADAGIIGLHIGGGATLTAIGSEHSMPFNDTPYFSEASGNYILLGSRTEYTENPTEEFLLENYTTQFKSIKIMPRPTECTVIFKVVNGAWADNTTADKTLTVQPGGSLTAAQIPAPGAANEGYRNASAGAWDVTPVADTPINSSITYTFSFAAKDNPNIGAVSVDGTVYEGTAIADVSLSRENDSVPGTLCLDAGQSLVRGQGEYTWTFTPEDTDNYISVTGAVSITVSAPAVNIYGSNVGLYNDIGMNFFVETSKLDSEESYYALVTKGGSSLNIPQAQWESYNSSLVRFGLKGITAKEMCDEITVQIFFADGSPAGEIYTDSLRSYAMRMLGKASSSALLKTTLVDMLNYGAAAQTQFSYNTDDLANSLLTSEQQSLASAMPAVSDSRVSGDKYIGSSISLKSNILLSFYFSDLSSSMHAEISYVNHYGTQKIYTIPGSAFVTSGGYYVIDVSTLVVADVSQMVSCKVYNGDSLVAEAADSIESYIARMNSTGEIYSSVVKFAVSARSYFDSIS